MKILNKILKLLSLGFLLVAINSLSLISLTYKTGNPAAHQESQKEVAEMPREKPVLESIPGSDIALRSEEANTELIRMRSVFKANPEVITIDSEQPDFNATLHKSREKLETVEIETLSLRQLKDIREDWQLLRMKINTWQGLLAARIQIIDAEKVKLQKMRTLWELTRTTADKEGYPVAIKKNIQSVLSEIEDVENRHRERLRVILTLQGRISNQSLEIMDVLNRLETAQARSRQRLFTQDSPPLWKANFAPEKEISVFERIGGIWQKKSETLFGYMDENWERLLINLFVFVILSFILLNLRRRCREWPKEDNELKALVQIIEHPFSVTLLIALLLASYIYPHTPIFLLELIAIFFLVPLLRLLPGMVVPRLRPAIYGIGGLILFQWFLDQMPEKSAIQRTLLFVLITLTLGGLVWLSKRERILQNFEKDKKARMLTYYGRVAFVVFVIAWFANILGYVFLAQLLSEGTFLSIYILVILLASVMVLEGLMAVFLRSRTAQSLRIFHLHPELWKRKTSALFRIVALIIWISTTLENFTILEPMKIVLTDIINSPLRIGTLNIALGDILAFFVTLWISILLARFARFILGEDVLPRLTLPRGVSGAISFVAYYFILIVGFLFALSAAGIEWSRFALLAGALGIGIGFGLQNLVNNFVSGLILIFERPIKVGDIIEFGSLRGQVMRIGIRSSTILNWEGAEVIVPNGNLISGEIVNWTLSDRRRRITVNVGVKYGTDPNRVLEILNGVAKDHSSVLNNPAPSALFTGFGESSLDFELRFSIPEFNDWLVMKSEITLAINNALKDADIEIPYPQRDLHVRSIDPDAKKELTRRKEGTKS